MRTHPPNIRTLQKNFTLQTIKTSAREIFCERNYDAVSMEDVAEDAGVSRGTIYRHFANKADLLLGLLKDDLDIQMSLYEEIPRLELLDHKTLRNWLTRFAATMNGRGTALRLFPIVYRQMPDKSLEIVREHRERAIALLGEAFPGLDLADKHDLALERARAKAYILLFQLEQVSTTFSWAPGAPDLSVGLDILAERMLGYKRAD